MAIPAGIGVIDTLIGFPHGDMKEAYAFITRQTKDRQSTEEFAFPVEYMFKQVPEKDMLDIDDPVAVTLAEMDRWGIERGLIGVARAMEWRRTPSSATRTGSSPPPAATPTRGWRGSASWSGCTRPRDSSRGRFPGRYLPAGGDQRQEDVPDLRQVRGAGHPDLLHGRSPGSALEVRRSSTSS